MSISEIKEPQAVATPYETALATGQWPARFAIVRPLLEVHPETALTGLPDDHLAWRLQNLIAIRQEREQIPPHMPIANFGIVKELQKHRGLTARAACETLQRLPLRQHLGGMVMRAELAGPVENPRALKVVRLVVGRGLFLDAKADKAELADAFEFNKVKRSPTGIEVSRGYSSDDLRRFVYRYNFPSMEGTGVRVGLPVVMDKKGAFYGIGVS